MSAIGDERENRMRLARNRPTVVPPRVLLRPGAFRPRRSAPARRVALGAAVVGSLVLGVPVATAHTEVVSTSPSASRSASTGVRSVTVTFTGQIRSGTLTVRRGRTTVSAGRGGQDPRNVKRLKVGLKRGLKAARYTASWTIKAADGHVQKGTFTFRLKKR
jgi:methionine-rich copper-binding protein CopC